MNLLSAKSEIHACMDRTAPAPADGLLTCAGPAPWKEAVRVIISPDTIRRANIFIGRLNNKAVARENALRSALAKCGTNTRGIVD